MYGKRKVTVIRGVRSGWYWRDMAFIARKDRPHSSINEIDMCYFYASEK